VVRRLWWLWAVPVAVLVAGVVSEQLLSDAVWAGWGQWAGAVGSVAAVVVALLVALRQEGRESGAVRRELRRLGDERREARLAAARLVTATITWPDGDEARDRPPSVVQVINNGPEPILDPCLTGFVMDGGKLLPEGGCWQVDLDEVGRGSWGPSAVIRAGQDGFIPFHFHAQGMLSPTLRPVVEFTDSKGRRWRRVAGQTPEPAADPAP
jgi:hypothetical protein